MRDKEKFFDKSNQENTQIILETLPISIRME